MTQNRRQWAAITYPELPPRMSPEATARRAYVRIGVKVAKITLPVMLAAGFVAVAGHSSGPTYSGYDTAQAVMALTKTTEIVTCQDTSPRPPARSANALRARAQVPASRAST